MTNNIITAEQLTAILAQYSLGELSSPIEQLTSGWVNTTLKFTTKPDNRIYILREYLSCSERTRTLASIQFELNFIAHLYNDLNLPVVPMIDPPGVFKIDNGDFCAIFPFIKGVKYVNTPETPNRQLWQIVLIARFLGRMHLGSTWKANDENSLSDRPVINYVNIKYELVNLCQEFQIEHPDLYHRLRSIVDKHLISIPLIEDHDQQVEFQDQLEQNLPKGCIHADVHDDNVLFNEQNQIAAVLDFDDMYIGPLLIDIAMSLCVWCAYGSEFDFDSARQFLLEYQHERQMPLTENEWNLLELYCYLTLLNQILFTIQSGENENRITAMVKELLILTEQISKESEQFLSKIRQ